MSVVDILPRLWITNSIDIPKDKTFFTNNNIRYVINLTYDIPNYFTNVTYLNIPLKNDNFNENNIEMTIDQLFNLVNKFIVQGYHYGVGILIHDNIGQLSLMFGSAFIISKLKINYDDLIKYFMLHNNININYLINNSYLINYSKKFNNKACLSY